MRTEILKMSHEERQTRAQAKREVVLRFLTSGEAYTSVVVAAKLMVVSTSAAERTLTALVRGGAVKFESHIVAARKTHIYGIIALS